MCGEGKGSGDAVAPEDPGDFPAVVGHCEDDCECVERKETRDEKRDRTGDLESILSKKIASSTHFRRIFKKRKNLKSFSSSFSIYFAAMLTSIELTRKKGRMIQSPQGT